MTRLFLLLASFLIGSQTAAPKAWTAYESLTYTAAPTSVEFKGNYRFVVDESTIRFQQMNGDCSTWNTLAFETAAISLYPSEQILLVKEKVGTNYFLSAYDLPTGE